MITELYIDGQRLDLFDDIDIRLTYSITDIENPIERKSSVSRTIEIPKTANNDKVFGSIYRFDQWIVSFDPSVRATAYVMQNGIQVFEGIAQLLAVKDNGTSGTCEIGLYGETTNLFKQLGDAELTDLDFSELNHEWDASNVVDAWFNSIGSTGNDYYYPLIDYGQANFQRATTPAPYVDSFNTEDFYPAISVKKYVDKIFASAGFTYESDFFTSQWFKQLIVPYGISGVPYITDEQAQTNLYYIRLNNDVPLNGIITQTQYQFGTATPDPYFNGGNYNTGTYKFTAPSDRTYNFQIRVTITNIDVINFAPYTFTTALRKNGVIIVSNLDIVIPAPTLANNTFTKDFFIQDTATAGDQYDVVFGGGAPFIDIRIESSNTFWLNQIAGTPQMAPGDDWDMNQTIVPKVKQSEFLMYLVRMFNLFIMPDKYNPKKLYVEPFTDFYDNANPIDWTDKWDVEKGYEVVPCGYMNPKTYKFQYKDGGGYFEKRYQQAYGEGYGSRKYISSNEFSNGEQSEDVGFSNSVMVGFQISPRIYARYYDIDNKGTASGGDVALNVKPVTPNLRILYHEYIEFPSDTEFAFEGNDYTSYPYAGTLDNPYNPTTDLCFGIPRELYYQSNETTGAIFRYTNNNLFNRFWLDYVKLYTDKDAKKVKLFMQLTPVDIANLDFRKLIYINGVLFYLLAVNDYDANSDESTSVELLKVLDLDGFVPTVFELTSGTGASIDDEPKPQIITE